MYWRKIKSICVNGISESFLEARNIPGDVTYYRSSKLTSYILKDAFLKIIGLIYFKAIYKTIFGKNVFCFPIYKNNYFKEMKGLSKTEIIIFLVFLFFAKYLNASIY